MNSADIKVITCQHCLYFKVKTTVHKSITKKHKRESSMQKNSEEGIRGAQPKVPNTHISEIEVVASRYKQMTGPAD